MEYGDIYMLPEHKEALFADDIKDTVLFKNDFLFYTPKEVKDRIDAVQIWHLVPQELKNLYKFEEGKF